MILAIQKPRHYLSQIHPVGLACQTGEPEQGIYAQSCPGTGIIDQLGDLARQATVYKGVMF